MAGMTTNAELLPCPFCGKDINLLEGPLVRCFGHTEWLSRSEWNTRAHLTQAKGGDVPQGYVLVKAERLLACKDAFIADDYREAYHQLYMAAHDEAKSKYLPFDEWMKSAGRSYAEVHAQHKPSGSGEG